MKTKNKLVVRSIVIKEEAKNVMFSPRKRHIKGEKYMDFKIYGKIKGLKIHGFWGTC